MILLISVLILVHEAGHFFSARLFKIKVDKFGIGLPIGPTLFEKKVGDITLVIHAFLFGGYVSFPDDDKESDIPQDSQDRLMNRPIWQRAIVFSSGVLANVVCAFVLVLLTASLWHNLPSGKFDFYVADITAPKEASVWQSGLQKGDKIVEINGSKIDTKYGVNLYALHSASFDGKTDKKIVEENYKNLKAINPAFTQNEIIEDGLIVKLPKAQQEEKVVLNDNILNAVALYKNNDVKLTPEQIILRDEIQNKNFIEANGKFSLNDLAWAMSDNQKPLDLKVLRDNQVISLNTLYSDKDGLIGILSDKKEVLIPITNIKTAIKTSYNYLYNETKGDNIDILINNAGFGAYGYSWEVPLETELNMLDLNVRAVHILTKLFLQDFRKRDHGYILNVASSAGFLAGPLMSTYYATKSYVLRLTEAIHEELRRSGSNVKISALCPGHVETGFDQRANVKHSIGGVSARSVAKCGINGMFRGDVVILPGILMKLTYLGEKFLTEPLMLRAAYLAQSKKG